ncbi:hypothetical protein HY948_02105, partial [Candidatus Gottesmanbacteria bacterium]|nr:hypothetical protein [Candidatus Gottesmanbacteria bacterium]
VESRHVTGRPLSLAFINDTAKHAELETYLESQKEEWQKDYFILPPLAPDGLGYTVYISNDAIGNQETINDIKSIKFYRIPYQELVTLHSPGTLPKPPELQSQGRAISVEHSNPAYFKIVLRTNELMNNDATLVLSQAFDPGWLAFTRTTTFPFFQPIKDHVLVNNWKNGWTINQTSQTVILFFWPQLLEWFGFLLLPIPFILPFLPKIFLTK